MSETKLKRCPFCGGEAEFVRDTERIDIFDSSDFVYVRCKECKAQTRKLYYSAVFHKEDEEYEIVGRAWNTRKPMENIVERLEAEKAVLTTWAEDEAYKLGINKAIEIVKEEGEK